MAPATSTINPPPLSKSEESCTDDSETTEDDLTVSDHVRVIVRCRPLKHDSEEDSSAVLFVDASRNKIEVVNPSTPPKVYRFCCVADATRNQNFVFEQTGKPIVECALAGFNGAIVAYGQTGSGKTFTMQGASLTTAHCGTQSNGIIQSVCETIFAHVRDTGISSNMIKFTITASYLEIYNETLIDLLSGFDAPGKQIRSPSAAQANSTSQSKLTIREDSKGQISVVGLSHFEVDSPERCYLLLKAGAEKRTVGATKMNIESSRSHAVFTLSITKRSIDKGMVRTSRLHLVDLAGSERQKGTGATGIRLREAGGINKSLSALGNVINALSARESSTPRRGTGLTARVPSYRDSKLTFLLKDSLGGNAKLCLIATISPALASMEETLSTLEFAKRCAAVRNEAVVNESLTEDVTELQREVRRLQKSLKHMQMSLSQAKAAEADLRVTCHVATGDRNFKGSYLLSHEKSTGRKDVGTQVELAEDSRVDKETDVVENEVESTLALESPSNVDKNRTEIKNETSSESDTNESIGTENDAKYFRGNEQVQAVDKQMEKKKCGRQEAQRDTDAVRENSSQPIEPEAKPSLDEMNVKWKEMLETNHRLWEALTEREKELTELREGTANSIADGTSRRLRQELELMRVRAENNPEIVILKHRVEAYESTFQNAPSSPVTPSNGTCTEKVPMDDVNGDKKGIIVNGGILKTSTSKRLACSASIGCSDWLRGGHSIAQRLRSGGSRHGSPTKSVSFADGVKSSNSASSFTKKCCMIQDAIKTATEERMTGSSEVATAKERENSEKSVTNEDGLQQGLRRTVTRRKEFSVSSKDKETQPSKESARKHTLKTGVATEDWPSKKRLPKRSEKSYSSPEPRANVDLQEPQSIKGKDRAGEGTSLKRSINQNTGARELRSDDRHIGESEDRRKGGFATDDSWIRARSKPSPVENQKRTSVTEMTDTRGMTEREGRADRGAVVQDQNWIKGSQVAHGNDRGQVKPNNPLYSEFGGGLSVLIDDLERSVAESEEL